MDRVERLFLNLSHEPPRNRNLFRVSFVILILAIFIFLFLDISSLSKGIKSYIRNEKIIETQRAELESISKENRELESKIIGLKKIYKSKVDTVNSLIEEKALSWLSLLSILEESLSDKTVLISLSPSGSNTLNAEISSENIEDLLRTVNNLSKNEKISGISILREREKEGQKIFLISLKLKG